MRFRIPLFVAAAFAGTCGICLAQNKPEEEAVRALPQAFVLAFNNHDAKGLARLMSEEVDFVNVGLTWLQGRAAFEAYHARLFSTRFRDIKQTLIDTHVRFVRPDVAVVRFS